jgi:hypothetical protein
VFGFPNSLTDKGAFVRIESPCSKSPTRQSRYGDGALRGIYPVRKMSINISLANPAASRGEYARRRVQGAENSSEKYCKAATIDNILNVGQILRKMAKPECYKGS